MVAKIKSGAVIGVNGHEIIIEVDVSQGMPAFDIVGLPDSAVKESRERVMVAIKNIGLSFPVKRITVNLAPADIKKEGPSYDLPIAIGILVCMGIIPAERVEGIFFVGELSLDALIRPVNGVLPMVYSASVSNIPICVVPSENGNEAALVKNVTVFAAANLQELIDHFNGKRILPQVVNDISGCFNAEENRYGIDFSDVKGQENVKRALEISAAGRHNVIMIGPPGSGKTMLAKRLPTIMPDLTFEESIEVTKIYSVAGHLQNKSGLITVRPFRSPHHTVSYAALVGGGRVPKPGEISLSHNGILFLDELTEFQRNVLEVMRQPLEDGEINISRAHAAITYPANFTLLTSMNPCPCGFFGNSSKCTCTQNEINRYLGKISGPLLDRIDIQVEASAVNYQELGEEKKAKSSWEIKKHVINALKIQKERYEGEGIRANSELSAAKIEQFCKIGKEERNLLQRAFDSLGLSARAYHKILKVSRTIADLESEKDINVRHIAEAIGYRSLDRKYWNT